MKKLLLVVVIVAVTSGQVFGQEPMKLNYPNFAPFSWKDTDGRMKGIFIDVHNEALGKRMEIPVTHTEYPWKRAQHLVKRGKADAFTTVPTPERREYTEISSESVVVSDMILFANKKNPKVGEFGKIRKISDLKGFRLLDYIGNGWAEKNLAGLNVTWGDDIKQILKALAAGRGDLFIHPVHVTVYNIKKLGLQEQILKIHSVMESVSFNLCIGKKSSYVNILPKFDETIREMRKDGTLQKIYDNYR
ncbi:transporter substrate-binding domain-containing protein [Desulfobacterales bacterium HSG2]|nr:transporter substrate-binding domain-containing protein [Desulfobacterales bacterium HSG2]